MGIYIAYLFFFSQGVNDEKVNNGLLWIAVIGGL